MSSSGSNYLDTIVGELTLLGGRRQSDAAHVAALTPPRRAHADRRREILFLFLDLGGGGAGGLARAMLERFTRTYWHCSGTVTSALRQAVAAANDHLLEENRLLPVSQRRRGGLACAVLRDDSLYLAHIGPAQALLLHGEQVLVFPAESRDEPEGLPLGVSSGLDVHFSHHYLSAGDRLLLTGQSWSKSLPEGALSAALSRGGSVEDTMLALEGKAGTHAASALIIEFTSQVASTMPAPATGQDLVRPTPERPYRGPPAGPRGRGRREATHRLRGVLTETGWLGRARQTFKQSAATLSDGARAVLTQMLPEPEPAPARRRRRAGRFTRENVPLMASIAIAIPLLVAFLVVTIYLQRSEGARREGLVNKAREALQVARQASDEDARARWDAALQAAQEALRVAPDDAQLVAMRDEALATLDALEHVLRTTPTLLGDLGPGQGRRLAAGRLQVYVLDVAQDQVTQYSVDAASPAVGDDPMPEPGTGREPTLVAYRGERVGDEEIGELRDVVWLEAGGARVSDALFILTDDNRLLQYSLSWGLSWVTFDTGLAHVNAHVMRPYDGKLYALDPQGSQVWRFPSSGDAFGPPEGYFPAAAPDLSSAIDVTIDGAVYILLADGRIYKFLGGEAQPYQPGGLPQALEQPVALVSEGDMNGGALYVADAGTQSIFALTKSGEFIHQLKAKGDTLAGLEALALEARNRTLYALAGGRLYALALPPLPKPPDASE
jgi:hypothetical protein